MKLLFSCHALDICILGTRLLRARPADLFCPSLDFTFRGKGSATVCESVEPPD